MPKEILLYSGIYNFVAEEIIKAIEENMDTEIILRENTPGGDVFATWGIIAKIQEHGNVTVKVDGAAFSGGANILLYANRVEALDVSTFMFHRADMHVSSPEQQTFLNKINADLQKKMEKRIDSVKLKAMKGVTIEELFNPETRVNLFLTAKEMKELGLVSKINKLEPSEITAMQQIFKIAAEHKPEDEKSKPTDMTIEKLKAEFPAIYAAIVLEGAKKEKDRVEAWLAYSEIDAKAVKKGIEDGSEVTVKVMAQMQVTALSKKDVQALQTESADAVETIEVTTQANAAVAATAEKGKGKTKEELAKEKALADFEAEVNAVAGIEVK